MNREAETPDPSAVSLRADPVISGEAAAEPAQPNSWELFNARQRWTLVFILFLIASSGAIDRAIVVILLEPIKQEFHVSDTALGMLTGVAFGIFYTVLGLPIARYADRGDRRLLITVSVGLWSLLTATCGLARSFLQLFLLRIGVGVGEAGGTGAPLMSLLYDYFPPKEQARAISVVNMSTISGALFGLIAGGFIAQYYGWRVTLFAAGLPGVLLSAIAFLALREPRRTIGFAIPNTGGESLMDAFRALIRKPTFVNIAIAQISFTFLASGALTFSQLYVIRDLHASVSETGLATGLLSIVSVLIGNVIGGLLADRLSRRNIAWLCWIPGYGMMLAFPFYAAAYLVPDIFSFTALSAVGAAIMIGVLPPLYISLLTIVGASRRATGFTIVQLFANLLGVTAGPIVAGLLSDLLSHSMGSAQGLRWAIILSLLAFLPTGVFMLRAARTIAADQEA